jgi:hypothetical protein
MNQKQKTKCPGFKKKCSLRCPFRVGFNVFSFFVHLGLVVFVASCFFSMAQSLSYISMTPDRSRSRDDPPTWGHPNPD